MQTLQEFGIALIQNLQTLSPALDGIMTAFTVLGRIDLYLLLLPFIYWSLDKRLGIRALLILIATDVVGLMFKWLFHQPRPYWIGDVEALSLETSYGIPSTHASDSLAVWGYLMSRWRKTWFWILGVLMVFFIGLSRLYLGVHFPHDVLFGWLIGAFMLWVFAKGDRPLTAWAERQSLPVQIGAAFAVSMMFIFIGLLIQAWLSGVPDPAQWSALSAEARALAHAFTLAGALFGAIAGYAMMRQHADFQIAGSWSKRAGRYLLGIIGMQVIYVGLDLGFALLAEDATPLGYALRYLRYSTVTFWGIYVAPWIFLKIGLAELERA